MAATSWLIRRRLHRRWLAMVPLALIVAAGATGAFVALGAAERTATAYSRYSHDANVGDLLINPSAPTLEIDRAIRSLPGVRAVSTYSLFNVGPGDTTSRTLAELTADQGAGEVIGSVDGRFAAMDRPALAAGRLPTGPNEAVIDHETADAQRWRIGDVVPVSFWSSADGLAAQDNPDPATVVTAAGVERLTIVGIATLPDEVLPDGLYPRQRAIVSPDVAARYDCHPRPLLPNGSYEENVASVFPDRCAISYRYYSLAIDGGKHGVAAAQDAFVRAGAELNAALPQAMKDHAVGYFLIPTTTGQERERVDRSTQPTVAALLVLGLAAAAVTAVVTGLAVARELRRAADDQRQWWRLGLTTWDRTRVVAAPMMLAVGAGLAVALGLAWWLSPIGPVGNVRSIEPHPGRLLSAWVGWGALGLSALLAVGVVVLAFVASRRVGRSTAARRDVPTVRRIIRSSGRPEVGEGVRAAFDGRSGAGLVMTSGAIAAAVFVAAVVFGASLSALVSSPRSYGWPWDVAVMGGYGYGGLDLGAVETTMAGRDDVQRWTALAFTNSVAVDNEPVVAMVAVGRGADVDLALAAGRLPEAADEVALGTRTAANHGVGVGDVVKLAGDGIEPRQATVTGLAVFPAIGPFESERASPGSGMLLPATMFDAADLAGLGTFVGVDITKGTDPQTTLAALRQDYGAWGADGFIDFADPVRPAEIVNAKGMRAIPLLVGGLLGVTVVLGLSLAVVVSVRARRRELGILRALGFTGRQLRDSVRLQALATMLAALVVGVPAGIVIGRLAWRAFASGLAVVQPPSTPVLLVLATVAGALVVAIVAASVPARMAARARPAVVLRTE
jgi:hypothetical protein